MATVRPFKAIRPCCEIAEKVVSLPYDVMDRKEAHSLAANNPYSFLHISRAEIDLDKGIDPYCHQVYEKAKENIKNNLNQGIFIEEETPALYVYKQEMNDREQTGIVGCVSIDEYKNNKIKKHEHTRVEKELDRINHFDVCDADTEPVFLAYREDAEIKTLVEGYKAENQPTYDIETQDGIKHTLWVIKDSHLAQLICMLFQRVPEFYIADGHHRSASACKVGELRREKYPDYKGDEEFNYFMAAIFPDTQLRIYDYNRVVKDLNGYSKEQLIEEVQRAGFDVMVQGTGQHRPEKKHEFSMYIDGYWYSIKCHHDIIPDDIIESLDVSILQDRILAPILGVEDPRTDNRIDFIGGIRGLKELERRATTDMKIAFALYPISMEELMSIADQNRIMPPKSTWFEPKLASGLFMHKL